MSSCWANVAFRIKLVTRVNCLSGKPKTEVFHHHDDTTLRPQISFELYSWGDLSCTTKQKFHFNQIPWKLIWNIKTLLIVSLLIKQQHFETKQGWYYRLLSTTRPSLAKLKPFWLVNPGPIGFQYNCWVATFMCSVSKMYGWVLESCNGQVAFGKVQLGFIKKTNKFNLAWHWLMTWTWLVLQ